MTTYWITGGTGLIGRHLVQRFLKERQSMVVLSRSAGKHFAPESSNNLVAIDFDLAKDDFLSLPEPKDDVVLFALSSKITTSFDLKEIESVLNCDTIGHLRLIESLKPQLRQIVYTSSATVYGWPDELPATEESPLNPENVYALNKTAMEMFLQQVRKKYSLPVSVIRISQVYGPGADKRAAMYRFLSLAHKNESPIITGSPDTIRDYCHVLDVVDAILLALKNRVDDNLNIGSGDPVSIKELAKICINCANSDKEPIEQDGAQESNKTSRWLDISKAKKLIKYNPKMRVRMGVKSEYERIYQPSYK